MELFEGVFYFLIVLAIKYRLKIAFSTKETIVTYVSLEVFITLLLICLDNRVILGRSFL